MVLVVNVRVALQLHATNSSRLSLSSFCMTVDHLHSVVMAAGRDCGQSRVIQVDLQAGYIVYRASDLLSSASVRPDADSQKTARTVTTRSCSDHRLRPTRADSEFGR